MLKDRKENTSLAWNFAAFSALSVLLQSTKKKDLMMTMTMMMMMPSSVCDTVDWIVVSWCTGWWWVVYTRDTRFVLIHKIFFYCSCCRFFPYFFYLSYQRIEWDTHANRFHHIHSHIHRDSSYANLQVENIQIHLSNIRTPNTLYYKWYCVCDRLFSPSYLMFCTQLCSEISFFESPIQYMCSVFYMMCILYSV